MLLIQETVADQPADELEDERVLFRSLDETRAHGAHLAHYRLHRDLNRIEGIHNMTKVFTTILATLATTERVFAFLPDHSQ